jgi:hypothetical protein
MIFSDRATVDLAAQRSVWPVTGGSGRFSGVRAGSITVSFVARGGADLKVRLVS